MSGTSEREAPGPRPEDVRGREIPFAALPREEAQGGEFVCALCGGRFGHGNLACAGCPVARGCVVVRCPHCGYQFPRSSALADRISRWAGRLRRRMR